MLCCRAAGYYGRLFKARRGVTQGGPLSPTIFNLMVDAIVREWERQLVTGGLGLDNMQQLFACFYADDDLLVAWDPKHLQLAFDLLTNLLDKVGLKTNTTKTKAMTFLPGGIRKDLLDEAYLARMNREARKAAATRKVRCEPYQVKLTASSLASHLETEGMQQQGQFLVPLRPPLPAGDGADWKDLPP